MRWIRERETDTPNPLDTIQFRELLGAIEDEIRAGTRKRIFRPDDKIDLNPEIIRGVVGRLEHLYLFGIDADLNGRLFETFLNATMRGKDLGQFFTPRSIVRLGTKLAELKATKSRQHIVLDACCGTGGFLIDALADMWQKIESNSSLSKREKDDAKHGIALHCIHGIDIGREPNMARLARMNMYLHGDGGGGIYEADFLDKELVVQVGDDPEVRAEKNQLAKLIAAGGFADIVLTNPPFAKEYSRSTETETRILDQYRIGSATKDGKRIARKSLRSSLMFLERYHDILNVGGTLITVIDDGILSGQEYEWFRNEIRESFVIKAVISLPGDAFQRSEARVKTSLLLLEKRAKGKGADYQGSVFMYPCRFVGIDDPARRRILPIDKENRHKAAEEIENVVAAYATFKNGKSAGAKYSVAASRITDRLDVKHCLESMGRKTGAWKKRGLDVVPLSQVIGPVEMKEEDVIITKESSESVISIVVGYDGITRRGEEMLASDMKYSELYRVHAGNIVMSNISAHYGATGIISDELDGCVVTSEVSIFRARNGYTPHVAWALLRSPEIRADLLLSASGANRTRVDWDGIKNIPVPIPPTGLAERINSELAAIEELERETLKRRKDILQSIESELDLASPKATQILEAYKPPQ
jgi:type I restriction enzyme M protein